MTFAADMLAFQVHLEGVSAQTFGRVADAVFSSIVEGSSVTGAPGQPVDTGNLKASWQNIPTDTFVRDIITNTVYAPMIEDGVRSLAGARGDAGVSRGGSTLALTLRSKVGGFHSVKLTQTNFDRLAGAVVSG